MRKEIALVLGPQSQRWIAHRRYENKYQYLRCHTLESVRGHPPGTKLFLLPGWAGQIKEPIRDQFLRECTHREYEIIRQIAD